MNSPVLVTGGTGTIGRRTVPLLVAAGRTVRVLSRGGRPADIAPDPHVTYVRADLLADGELDPALLGGAETVLHLAGGPKGDDAATARLVRAARAAGTVQHLVLVSVVGADAMPIGYFRAKAGAERAVMESGIGWTVLRAAQVNELLLRMVGSMRQMPLVPAPGGLRFQPVDAAEVAARLAELTLDAPAGRVPDVAGPGVYTLPELAAAQRTAAGARPRRTLPIRLPGRIGRAYRSGANLTGPEAHIAGRDWETFLAA
ncbi:NAD-dependent epimerase/dehydratase family protein [Streptomyces triticagri]|uniref:NAD-dependent epimerase/dehydratase family protein n=1 Tax=Streptomyces triticagri TaxID=2293568 RepID=A0A372M9U2_9ACTN|nr:NAD-dependent epimerase/dehydratase family protein [Streptomyces triticagri]